MCYLPRISMMVKVVFYVSIPVKVVFYVFLFLSLHSYYENGKNKSTANQTTDAHRIKHNNPRFEYEIAQDMPQRDQLFYN